MDRCSSCGAVLAAGVSWCGQCFAAVAAPAAAQAAVGTWAGPTVVAGGPQRVMRSTRWAKTPTTFGPVGRMLATVALLVPLVVMAVGGLADPFVWGGAGVWGVVVVPWALRDVWKAGRVESA